MDKMAFNVISKKVCIYGIKKENIIFSLKMTLVKESLHKIESNS